MKKEKIITITVILFIILAEIISQNYTNSTVKEFETKLQDLKNCAYSSDFESKELIEKATILNNDWKKRHNILAYYLEHEEIEKVDVAMTKILANFQVDQKEEATCEIAEGIYLLKHIYQKQRLCLKNIF